jgi:hypothetical protein
MATQQSNPSPSSAPKDATASRFRIVTPHRSFSGRRHGVTFSAGIGFTNDVSCADALRGLGYEVIDRTLTPPPASVAPPDDLTDEQYGQELRYDMASVMVYDTHHGKKDMHRLLDLPVQKQISHISHLVRVRRHKLDSARRAAAQATNAPAAHAAPASASTSATKPADQPAAASSGAATPGATTRRGLRD